jgi:hypothetical protein
MHVKSGHVSGRMKAPGLSGNLSGCRHARGCPLIAPVPFRSIRPATDPKGGRRGVKREHLPTDTLKPLSAFKLFLIENPSPR